MVELVNPFERQGRWFKANLHTHTTNSDGDATAQQRARQYGQKGYHIIAITDHEATTDVEAISSQSLLVVGGTEIHPACPEKEPDSPYHLVCLNVPHGFSVPDDCDANACIKLVKQAGGEVIIGHPYWAGQNITHLLAIDGYIGIEVFNATCTKIGKGFSSVQWDDLLEAGKIVPAVAVDDTHRGRDIFMGWTYVRAAQLDTEAVMESLRTGCYYSSCGPLIEDFHIADGTVMIKCSPVVEVHFIAQNCHGLSYYAEKDERLRQARFELGPKLKYVRAEIVDDKGNRAWTNPIVL